MVVKYCIYEEYGAWVCELNTGHQFWALSKDELEREIDKVKRVCRH